MERPSSDILRPYTKLSLAALAAALLGSATAGLAKESGVPLSSFRRYFWGAREAYEQRDFEKADRYLRTYQELGSPSDRLLKAAGCDPKWEVELFTVALKDAHACLQSRPKSLNWTDVEHAKFTVIMALRAGDAAALEPYVDCAPADLAAQATTCGAHLYHKTAELEKLAAALKKAPTILQWPNWREFPAAPNDRQNIRWMLYTLSDDWKPCGMPGTPIVSLRQDPSGEVRIAGFAASCLEPL